MINKLEQEGATYGPHTAREGHFFSFESAFLAEIWPARHK